MYAIRSYYARAGKTGVSICLVKMEEMAELNALESELGIRFSAIALEIEPDTTPVQPITVYMNMGLNQDFDSGSLREYLVEEAGLNMADITNVQVDDEQSQFDIPDKYQEQLFLNLKGVKRACRNMKMVVNTRKNMRIIKK